MRLLALFFIPAIALGAPASVSGGKTGESVSSAPTTTMQSTPTHHGGGTGRLREDLRNPPPLDPKREVTEQDCTKPVDLSKGNLKCK